MLIHQPHSFENFCIIMQLKWQIEVEKVCRSVVCNFTFNNGCVFSIDDNERKIYSRVDVR
jgi:hypothetical protein